MQALILWIDAIEKNKNYLTDAYFLIITTANAPEESAASLLRINERDENQAYTIFKAVADTSENKAHSSYYSAFI